MRAARRLLGIGAALCGSALVAAPAPATAAPPHVLVYSGTAGFRHLSIPYGNATLERLARLSGRYTVEFADQPSQLTTERLGRSAIVLWQNTTGTASPFTDEQETKYAAWVGCGGGHMGVHASADSYKDWPVWAELTGAFFASHPVTPTSAADDRTPEQEGWGEPEARILVKDEVSPVTAPWRGMASFLLRDEFYAWDRDPSGTIADFRPMLAFGGFTDPLVALMFGGDYADEQPLAWTGSFRGRNRISYTNLGHSAATWNRGDFQDSLLEAIAWVVGKRPDTACLRREGLLPPEPAAKGKPKAKAKKKKKKRKKKRRKAPQRRPASRA